MEEKIDDLCAAAGELGLLGVPVFMFQEGDDPVAENAYREIARLSHGAYCRFDTGAAHRAWRTAARGRGLCRRRHEGAGATCRSAQRSRCAKAAGADEVAMPALIFGVVVLVLVLWALNVISKVDPQSRRACHEGRRWAACARVCRLSRPARRDRRRDPARRLRARPARLAAVRAGGLCRAHAEEPAARPRGCARPISRWSSTTTAVRCADAFSPAGIRAPARARSTSRRWSRCLREIDEESRALLMAYLDRRDARLA